MAIKPSLVSERCEYNPVLHSGSLDPPLETDCRNGAVYCVGADGQWHLCASCAYLPEFKRLKKSRLMIVIGPTGEPPATEHSGDRGGLNAALILDRKNNVLRMEFGAAVTFVTMTHQEAVALADALMAKASLLH